MQAEVVLMDGDNELGRYVGDAPQVGETVVMPHARLNAWRVVGRFLHFSPIGPNWVVRCEAVIEQMASVAENRK